jgi:hypothetical protein
LVIIVPLQLTHAANVAQLGAVAAWFVVVGIAFPGHRAWVERVLRGLRWWKRDP